VLCFAETKYGCKQKLKQYEMGSIPFRTYNEMKYEVHPLLFLRAPFYSFRDYDLHDLPEVLQRSEFRLAVRLASTVFYNILQNKGFRYDQLSEKEIHTLRKYYNRMSFRATPFGCFATVSVLQWSSREEDIRLADNHNVSAAVTADWTFAQHGDAAKYLRLFKNPLLYRLGRSWRYIAGEPDPAGTYNFTLQELDAVKLNNTLFKKMGKGIDPESLAFWVAGQTGAEINEAADYIRYLTEEQVLIKDPGRYLIEPAGDLKIQTGAIAAVPLSSMADGHFPGPVYPLLDRPLLSGGPGPVGRQKLAEVVQSLSDISGPASDPALVAFVSAFIRRFDRQRVPLMEALDPDAGISYDDSNLAVSDAWGDTGFNTIGVVTEKPMTGWGVLHRLLFSLWKPGNVNHTPQPIRITSAQLSAIRENSAPLPSTLGVLFRTTTDGLTIEGISGASATQLIGRFSLLSGGALLQGEAMAAHEVRCNPEVIFADISHQSDEHVDNINRRRQLYPFEICLNTVSGLPQDAQIWPDDLFLSVRKGELILESQRLKKRIIPRLSTAFNFRRSRLPIFNLLCALQYQGLKAITVPRLERLFPEMTAYPRLYLEDVILTPATWVFTKVQLQLLTGKLSDEVGRALNDFRGHWALPAHITLGGTDQQLVFDLTDQLDRTCFLQEISGKETVTVREYLASDKTIRAGSDPLAGQYLAYLTHRDMVYRAPDEVWKVTSRAKRSFQPGSEWLYLQIFCTPLSANRILSDVVKPVVERMRKTYKTWFFIRYDEDGNHLRLRFKLAPAENARILMGVNFRLKITGLQSLVQNIRTETYRPELERYPFSLMPGIENVFETGSELILWLAGLEKQEDMLVPGLVTARMMLEQYGYNLKGMLHLSALISENFIKETGDRKQLRIELNDLFRRRKTEIAQAFSGAGWFFDLRELWLPFVKSVGSLAKESSGLPEPARQRLIADLIHMQLNRTFSEHQRRHEMSVWYCLHKYLKGIQAQSAKNPVQDREDESNNGLILPKNLSR
jgi:thiopeptide-type bacteriocin biosynthesis protein